MRVRATGIDEFTITLDRAEATHLVTGLVVAFENDGREQTDWSDFAGDVAYVLHHELIPAIKHNCRCSVCRWKKAGELTLPMGAGYTELRVKFEPKKFEPNK